MNVPQYNCPTCGQVFSGSQPAQRHMMECKRQKVLEEKKEAEEREREIERQASTFEVQFVTWLRTPHGRFELFWAETRRDPA